MQGAHIYPKGRDGSDDLRNGLCLCRRHHWAMDAGWISIADDYTILVCEDLPDHDDYQFIAQYEGEKISLPSLAESAPDIMYLREQRNLDGLRIAVRRIRKPMADFVQTSPTTRRVLALHYPLRKELSLLQVRAWVSRF